MLREPSPSKHLNDLRRQLRASTADDVALLPSLQRIAHLHCCLAAPTPAWASSCWRHVPGQMQQQQLLPQQPWPSRSRAKRAVQRRQQRQWLGQAATTMWRGWRGGAGTRSACWWTSTRPTGGFMCSFAARCASANVGGCVMERHCWDCLWHSVGWYGWLPNLRFAAARLCTLSGAWC